MRQISFKPRRCVHMSTQILHSLFWTKFRQVRKCLGHKILRRTTCPKFWFGSSTAKCISFEGIPKFVAIIQNARAKQNLRGLGLETKIACARNIFQTRLAITNILGPFGVHLLKFTLPTPVHWWGYWNFRLEFVIPIYPTIAISSLPLYYFFLLSCLYYYIYGMYQ